MTTSAWILLLTTWSLVAGLSIFLVYKVLTTPPRDGD